MAKESPNFKPLELTLKSQTSSVFLNIKGHILGIHQIAISYGKILNRI